MNKAGLLNFFHQIDQAVNVVRDMHIVLANYPTPKDAHCTSIAEKPSRFNRHFARTGGSWLNLLERFFAEMITKSI
jgi:transposase